MPLRKSPLDDVHTGLGAHMTEFAGWSMPLRYRGIIDEHNTVREAAGLFDISHMGQVLVTGTGCEAWMNTMLSSDIRLTSEGFGQYSLMLSETGGIIDDLIVYRMEDKKFLLIVNAARVDEDLAWMKKKITSYVDIENTSETRAAMALQGPSAEEILKETLQADKWLIRRYEITEWPWEDETIHIARTGYTGEDGFEIFMPAAIAPDLWKAIMNIGADLGCTPVGLGARDSLRLEMGYGLYGMDFDEKVNPFEAGLGWTVDFDKPERFIGRKALVTKKEKGISRRLVGLKMLGDAPPPRHGYIVRKDGKDVGHITSGTRSPSMGCGIGLAMLSTEAIQAGTRLSVMIRDRDYEAEVVKKPIYQKP